MSYITLKCKNCGSNMSLNTESHSATCVHCGSTFLLSEILDEKDMAFAEKFTPKNLEKKMMAQGAIKQGETFLFQTEFEKAETSFKRAIDLDDSNYKAYLGVVKAKTQNLNKLPENDDYLQYAHYALSLATDDDLVLVKSELAKIELLRREKIRQKKIKSSKKKREEQRHHQARKVSKISLILSIFILTMITIFLFISSGLTSIIFEGFDGKKTINIDSYESLNKVFSSNKYLNYEINITDDIDCNNHSITPLGTKNNAFTGIFNGNKHTISNLEIKVNPDTHPDFGFFGYTDLANINNVVFDNVSLNIDGIDSSKSISSCGLLAGTINSSIIKNIEIKDSCSFDLTNAYINNSISSGGLIGKATNSSHISNISSHLIFTTNFIEQQNPADLYIGGIVGQIENSDIQNTCSNSQVHSSLKNNSYSSPNVFIGGICGIIKLDISSNISNIKNNFFSGLINSSLDNTNYTLSAIAKSTANPSSPLNNYCLFTATKFKYNNSYLSRDILGDYFMNNYFTNFCDSNYSYFEKFSSVFSTWKNSSTFTPSLV